MDIEAVAREIVDSAIRVHTKLGPGMLESAYEACLAYELTKRGVAVRTQVPMPIRYDEVTIDVGFRIDLLIEEAIVVELKAVASLLPIHTAQLLSYLRAGDHQLGFLLNFHAVHMRDGIRRAINAPSGASGASFTAQGAKGAE